MSILRRRRGRGGGGAAVEELIRVEEILEVSILQGRILRIRRRLLIDDAVEVGLDSAQDLLEVKVLVEGGDRVELLAQVLR